MIAYWWSVAQYFLFLFFFLLLFHPTNTKTKPKSPHGLGMISNLSFYFSVALHNCEINFSSKEQATN